VTDLPDVIVITDDQSSSVITVEVPSDTPDVITVEIPTGAPDVITIDTGWEYFGEFTTSYAYHLGPWMQTTAGKGPSRPTGTVTTTVIRRPVVAA